MDYEGLYVKMLGGFSVSYDGKTISLGRKSTLKYMQMLQLIWLCGKEGIRKELLIDALYGWSGVLDANNSVNNLLHQIRRHLQSAGLPKSSYITLTEGVYRGDSQMPVRTDVMEFEELVTRGLETEDREESEMCLRQAFDLYQGELLPAISTEIWVIEKQLHLKQTFTDCVLRMGTYGWERRDVKELEYIYEKAARIYPDDGWEIKWIDVLIEQGECEKAYQLYQKMTHDYVEQMGLPPTSEMTACYERIKRKQGKLPSDMEKIRRSLEEQKEQTVRGAYFCGYQSFLDLCCVVQRNMERQGYSAFLILCTLTDYKGRIIRKKDKRMEQSRILERVINSCLRESDAFTRYNSSQYLILLVGISWENCDLVYRRIRNRLQEHVGKRAMVAFEALSMVEMLQE